MSSSAARLPFVPPKKRSKKVKSKTEVVRVGSFSTAQSIVQPKFPLRESFDNQVYNIIQAYNAPSITSSNAVNQFQAFAVQLNNVDQYSSMIAVFDQYRIVMAEFVFMPTGNQLNTSSFAGLFTTVVDYDDVTPLTSVAAALDYSNSMTGEGYQPQRRVFKPHVAIAAYQSVGVTSGYANVESPWIDAASYNVQHYGVKTVWTVTTAAYRYDVVVRLWLQFRNVR